MNREESELKKTGFDFAMGEWRYTVNEKQPDGSYHEWPSGWWKFWPVLGGPHVQDEFSQPTPDGDIVTGTMIRAYHADTELWHCRGIGNRSSGWDGDWDEYQATDYGDRVVMIGKSPSTPGVLQRVTFDHFQANSWQRCLDISSDEGNSWIERLALVVATRIEK